MLTDSLGPGPAAYAAPSKLGDAPAFTIKGKYSTKTEVTPGIDLKFNNTNHIRTRGV
jgi:hypothetical protein